MLDACGNVIGVIQSKVVDEAVEGVAYALAADSVRALLPSVRAGSVAPSSTTTTLEIDAICNVGDHHTLESCRASAASGLDGDRQSRIWARGIVNWGNVRYRFDGGAALARGEPFAAAWWALAPGRHTIAIVEQQAAGWTEWSAPYRFTIRDQVATLVITALCNTSAPLTLDGCRAAEADGLDPDESWVAWVDGVDDYNSVRYSIDGGEPGTRDDLQPLSLADGLHTIQVIERQAAGWTAWSAPYVFTVRDRPATLAITAFCNRVADTPVGCRTAAASGLNAGEPAMIFVDGVEDFGNVRYSIDGGAAGVPNVLDLRSLAPGPHTVQAIEQQAAGWTGWSEPYWFTISR